MPSARLQQQFIRLWQCCEGKSQDTTLNELAALLSCSRRHMRTLLNTMQDRGWLTWEAEVGRGKRSRLTFLYTGLALQQQRAEDLLEQDRIDQLVQLVGDKATVRQMLVSHLGRSFRQGRHILRVLYYRPLRNLLPGPGRCSRTGPGPPDHPGKRCSECGDRKSTRLNSSHITRSRMPSSA